MLSANQDQRIPLEYTFELLGVDSSGVELSSTFDVNFYFSSGRSKHSACLQAFVLFILRKSFSLLRAIFEIEIIENAMIFKTAIELSSAE